MKKILTMIGLVMSIHLYAGPGHHHSHGHGHSHSHSEVSQDEVKKIASTHMKRLIKAGKLSHSWKKSTFDKSEKKKFGKNLEWVVTFDNPKGAKGKKLYVFLKLSGDFVAANFTGK